MAMATLTRHIIVFIVVLLSAISSEARPLVRNIKDQREFETLLKHHAKNTGLPVVADFFSESCGPCRMMAPIFKKMAKEYEGKAVFVKIDTAKNRQLQSTYRVNSIPTFIFFVDGKRKKDFAGAGEQQLKQYTREIVAEAEKLNVRLTLESLIEYYGKFDESKSESSIKELYGKCSKMSSSSFCDGGPAMDLANKLQKKYKSKPILSSKISTNQDHENKKNDQKEEKEKPKKEEKPKRSDRKKTSHSQETLNKQPNLELATLDELERAVASRRADLGLPPVMEVNSNDDDIYDDDEEEDDEDDEDENAKKMWSGSSSEAEKIVIIGSGPAGLATAVYAARAGLKPVVVAPPFGGQLMGKGVDVENFPGLLGQTGPGVVNLMMDQAASFGTEFEEHLVTSVDLTSSPKRITTNVSTLLAHTVVVATGADSRWLGVQGEWEFRGGGVSTCATCDGFLFRDKDVVVVGGGDTAMEDALVLARTSSSVTLMHRRDTFAASFAMASRVLKHPKITILWNTTVSEFIGTPASGTEGEEDHVYQKLTGVVVRTNDGSGMVTKTIPCAAAFVAIGHVPNTKLFENQLDMGSDGYVHVKTGTSTSIDGVFAAGDVADHVYRQAITSAGSGAMAALDAERWLSAKGLGDDDELSARDEL